MADEKHLRLVVRGGYSTGVWTPEEWQFGLRLALVFGDVSPAGDLPNNWAPVSTDQEVNETTYTVSSNWKVDGPLVQEWIPGDYLSDVVAPVLSYFINQPGITSTSVVVKGASLYPIGPDGRVLTTELGTCVAHLDYKAPLPHGVASSSLLPPQNSVCVSLQTPVRGRHGRGRIYLPVPPSGSLDGVGEVSTVARGQIVAATAAMLEDLSVTSPLPENPNVEVIVTGAPWTKYGRVDEISVGNIVDTQRRRRNQLPEVRTVQQLVH